MASWGMPLASAQLAQFALYARTLQEWNVHYNLTAINDPAEITTRHFLDSLSCARYWGDTPRSLIDIGSGAGFPGLPLKLLQPSLTLTVLESVEKKARFVRHMVDLLGLEGVDVVVARAETLAHDARHREHYDVAVARAVAELRVLAEYCLPFCRIGGRMLAPKGARVADELAVAGPAIRQLGGELLLQAELQLPGRESHSIVVIGKRQPAPAHYPRRPGVPTRRPL